MQNTHDFVEPHVGEEPPVVDLECRRLPPRDASVRLGLDRAVGPSRVRAVSGSHGAPTSFSRLIRGLLHTVSSPPDSWTFTACLLFPEETMDGARTKISSFKMDGGIVACRLIDCAAGGGTQIGCQHQRNDPGRKDQPSDEFCLGPRVR